MRFGACLKYSVLASIGNGTLFAYLGITYLPFGEGSAAETKRGPQKSWLPGRAASGVEIRVRTLPLISLGKRGVGEWISVKREWGEVAMTDRGKDIMMRLGLAIAVSAFLILLIIYSIG